MGSKIFIHQLQAGYKEVYNHKKYLLIEYDQIDFKALVLFFNIANPLNSASIIVLSVFWNDVIHGLEKIKLAIWILILSWIVLLEVVSLNVRRLYLSLYPDEEI